MLLEYYYCILIYSGGHTSKETTLLLEQNVMGFTMVCKFSGEFMLQTWTGNPGSSGCAQTRFACTAMSCALRGPSC